MTDFSDLPRVRDEGFERLEQVGTLDDLKKVEADLLGKGSAVSTLQRSMGGLDPDERRARGAELNEVRSALQDAVAEARGRLEAEERRERLEAERLDLTEFRSDLHRGHLHLLTQTRDRLEDVFVGMGFTVAEGPEVETDWRNFQALNVPKAHPARNSQDTLYFDYGDESESVLFRTHTSPVQIRVMQAQEPPIYSVMPGRVYRKDTPDARHTPTFSQIEGLVVDRGIAFADLAGTIETFTHAYFGPNIESRLRPAYFPFTEPSAEFEVTCPICEGSGCRTCSDTGWLELGGCGMVHPNVFSAVGIDPEQWSGFAFGFGIDRLAQVFHSISDMRVLLDNDIRFVSQF